MPPESADSHASITTLCQTLATLQGVSWAEYKQTPPLDCLVYPPGYKPHWSIDWNFKLTRLCLRRYLDPDNPDMIGAWQSLRQNRLQTAGAMVLAMVDGNKISPDDYAPVIAQAETTLTVVESRKRGRKMRIREIDTVLQQYSKANPEFGERAQLAMALFTYQPGFWRRLFSHWLESPSHLSPQAF